MEKIITNFLQEVNQRNTNEPEFMQAVSEVAQTVIPYIVANDIYHGSKRQALFQLVDTLANAKCPHGLTWAIAVYDLGILCRCDTGHDQYR